MSDVAVIVTGAVGLAGIGGTFWTARLGWNREDRRAKVAEKRRIYAGCLAAYSKMAWPLIDHRSAHNSDDLEWKKQANARIKADQDNLGANISELRLIAPAGVAELAEKLQDVVSDFISDSLDHTDVAGGAARPYNRLYQAMRADLGEPPLSVDLAEATPDAAQRIPQTTPSPRLEATP